MEAKTKALIAAVVVLALALSAVSGVTYSWFSDSESTNDITVSTATVDLKDLKVTVDGVEQTGTTVSVDDIRPGMSKVIGITASNNSSGKVLYRIYAVYENGSNMTKYDNMNIQLRSTVDTSDKVTTLADLASSLNDTDILKADTGSGKVVLSLSNWNELAASSNVSAAINISAPDGYGGDVSAPVTYIDSYSGLEWSVPSGTQTSTDSNGTVSYTDNDNNTHVKTAWSPDTKRSFSLKFVVQAVQADYTPAVYTQTAGQAFTTGQNAVKYTSTDDSTNVSEVKVSGLDVTSNGTAVSDLKGYTLTVSETADTGVSFSVAGASTINLSLTNASGTSITGTDVSADVTVMIKGIISDPAVAYAGSSSTESVDVTGYYYTKSGDDYYTVITFHASHFSTYEVLSAAALAQAYPAAIDGELYASISDAISKAGDSETVVLTGDSSIKDTLTISKSVTIDGQGHTLTAELAVPTGTSGAKAIQISNSSAATISISDLTLACGVKEDNRTYGIVAGGSGAMAISLEGITIKDFGYKGLFVQNNIADIDLASATIKDCVFDNTSNDFVTVEDASKGGTTTMGGDHALQFDLRHNTNSGTTIVIQDVRFVGQKNGYLSEIEIADKDSGKTISSVTISGCTFSTAVAGTVGDISIGSTPSLKGNTQDGYTSTGSATYAVHTGLEDFSLKVTSAQDGTTVTYRGDKSLCNTTDSFTGDGTNDQNKYLGYEAQPVKIVLKSGSVLTATPGDDSSSASVAIAVSGSYTVSGEKANTTVSAAEDSTSTGATA